MKVLFWLLALTVTTAALANNNLFLNDSQRTISVEFFAKKMKIMDGSIELFKGRLNLINNGEFSSKTKIKACPEIKISIHSSLDHGVRGTLATIELVKLSDDVRCDELSSIVGNYTRQDFAGQ